MSMTNYVGGIRARLVSDNFYEMVRGSLELLGWFDAGRQHAPIEMARGEQDWSSPIPINTLAISEVDIVGDEIELGSNLMEDRWTAYVDFFAADDSLGTHMAGDVRDILRGKMGSIGRDKPILSIYDRTLVPPPPLPLLFTVDIENVIQDRAHNQSRPWQQHWFSVRCDLVDTYGDEDYA